MKTIDEFATEYARDKYMPVQTSQAVKAGAEYVLDVIQTYVVTEHYSLEHIIEQLRK